jgi:hypothetical protein
MPTIIVPDDQPDLASAIAAAAASGDTILIRDGTYSGANNRNLDPGSKQIHIRSENGAQNCTFDCGLAARFMCIHGGQTRAFIVEGLKIRRGQVGGSGGGVYCTASPTFKDCIIQECRTGSSGSGAGWFQNGGNPLLKNCLLHANITGTNGHGAAVTSGGSSSHVELENCTITNNTATGLGAYGGGIGLQNFGSQVTATNCIIYGNTAGSGNGNEIYIQGSLVCTLNYCDYGNGPGDILGTPVTSNCITSDPLYTAGPYGSYYLSHIAAGQGSDSPCIDIGSDTAANLGLDTFTTRTDNIADTGTVDLGHHFSGATPAVTPSPFGNVNYLGGGIR